MSNHTAVINSLVSRFKAEELNFCASSSKYSESEARSEFIDPLFSTLGWDMNNSDGISNSMKDIVREESQPTETSAKRPDYTFRIAAQRKFFVEAKKPAVDIRTNKESAFQVRSYGWTAGLPISILTNFRSIRVYDTSIAPQISDDANVALLLNIDYSDLQVKFSQLNDLFGREAVANGSIETNYGSGVSAGLPINHVFLERFNDWRIRIARDLYSRYPSVGVNDLNDIAQKVINRFIFIRMCEDRGIEGQDRLKEVISKKNLVELRKLFCDLDQRYNTGLFDVTQDPLQTTYHIDSLVLQDIVNELYFPLAPYSFSVLDADFLGQVYELFLTKRMIIDASKTIALVDKPAYEGREVVTTPQPLVDELVRRTIRGRFITAPTSLYKLKEARVLDMAVGSGRFLLRCLDELVDIAINICISTGDTKYLYKRSQNDYRLSFNEKRDLLSKCLFGIDIDFNAVEVARFSLLIKLLEDETDGTLPKGSKILPNLDSNIQWGNSIVDSDFTDPDQKIMDAVQPMNWMSRGLPVDYDSIVGNPPYVKTEDMKLATPQELAYFKIKYRSAYKQFDKYFMFIENALSKLNEGAWLGMVVPNKWMTIEAGKKLRGLLSTNKLLTELVDFGNELLFEGKSTYVCLLVLSKSDNQTFHYRRVDNFSQWLQSPALKGSQLPYNFINKQPEASWILPATPNEASVLAILNRNSYRMADVAEILNGIQTSADKIYAINTWTESNGHIQFIRDGFTWSIEKSLTKPYLMDSKEKVHSYRTVEPDALVIFPYTYGLNREAILIPPATLKSKYPLAWAYLSHYQSRLQNRDISPVSPPGEYYRYGRHQALNSAFRGNKIIYSVNQLGDKYGYDDMGVGFASGGTAGEVSITNPKYGYTIEFLLALLHQRAVEYFLRKRGSPFRGGYYSRGSAVVSDCPVPKIDFSNKGEKEIVDVVTGLVKELITIQDSLPGSAGRSRESKMQKKKSIEKKIKEQFELIWAFNGLDLKIDLPGE